MKKAIHIPTPDLQIGFAQSLSQIRSEQLQDALRKTVSGMDVPTIDHQLAAQVPAHDLALLAGRGLRGELLFAVPCVLETNPKLLAYYRLLLGFSQKEFYAASCAGATFKCMEFDGKLKRVDNESLFGLCAALIASASTLLQWISPSDVRSEFLDDLTLLTLGPQLRGGANVKRGSDAIAGVFALMGRKSKSFTDFRSRIISMTGIPEN